MKILLSILLGLFSLSALGQTTPLSFTTSTADIARPGAGAEKWIGQFTATGLPGPIDDYARFHWALDFQPGNSASNQYNWTALDQAFQSAINNNHKLSFGIMQTCSACGTDSKIPITGGAAVYPVYLHNQMQAEARHDILSNGEWIPHYNSPSYLAAWKALHIAVENHIATTSFQGVPYTSVVRWIDVNGFGDFGEWTNNVPDINSGDPATVATLDSIISAVVWVHRNTHCQLLNATFDCGRLSTNTNIPVAVAYFALTITNNTGKQGYRRESWGNTATFYDDWTNGNTHSLNGLNFGPEITARWQFAPITGELQDACQANHFSALSSQVSTYNILSFGNGNLDNCETGNATAYANIAAAGKLAGYRLTLTGGSTTTSLTAGGTLAINLQWKNNGTTPTYDHWKVKFKLISGTTVKWTGISSFDPYLFLPSGSSNSITDNFTLTNVPAGTGYFLEVSVEDANAYQRDMPIFITTAQNADGSYTLRNNITVGGGSPVASAGLDQTITLPTSSVTLDGTSSSGASSYAWSQISGPNIAILTNSATSVATASNLIAGVYLFQLQVNGGSKDFININVNPAVPPATTIFTNQVPKAVTDNDIPGGANTFTGQELGMRFTSTIDGFVTGIRFYKTAGNAGTHTGELYTNTGTRLASAIFQNETTTGWQVAQFAAPIAVTANTTYVAAYFSDQGFYVEDNGYFLNKAVTNTNLIAPADGLNGAAANPDLTNVTNGPYKYCSTPSFPDHAFSSANYWVDIEFTIQTPNTIIINKASNINFIKVGP